jgi:transcriptional regulator with XRE-family HTH domain
MLYQRIKDLREDSKLTQEKLIQSLNIKQDVYQKYESGEKEIPIDIIIALVKFYNVSADYIVGFIDVKRPPLK